MRAGMSASRALRAKGITVVKGATSTPIGEQANPAPGHTFRGSDLKLSLGSVLSGATALLLDLGTIAVRPRRAEGGCQRKTIDTRY